MRQSIKTNEPPKAFAGMALAIGSAIASIAGSAINAYTQRKNAKAALAEQQRQNDIISANNMTDYMNQSQNLQDQLDLQSRMQVRCGGRRKLKNGGSSSTGVLNQGVRSQYPLIKLANGLYYDNSRRHEDGGNDIKKNGKVLFEEEKGEVLDLRHGGEARVLSSMDNLGTGNMSPADLVLSGVNPDVAYNIQESHKKGNRQSIKRTPKAAGGWSQNIGNSSMQYGDLYNSGINLLTNGINTAINLSAIKGLKKPSRVIDFGNTSSPTRYYTGAQVNAVNDAAKRSRDYIGKNFTSVNAAFDAMRQVNEQQASQLNTISENKQNKEIGMITENNRYLDAGRQRMAALANQYNKDYNDYLNQLTAMKSNAWQTGISSISSTIDNLHKTIDTREQNDMNSWSTLLTMNPAVAKYAIINDPNRARRYLSKEYVDKVLADYAEEQQNKKIDELTSMAEKDSRELVNRILGIARCGGRKSLKR